MLKKLFVVPVIALGLVMSASASTGILVKAKLETGFAFSSRMNAIENNSLVDDYRQVIVSFTLDKIECSASGKAFLTDSHRAGIVLDTGKCGDVFYKMKTPFYDGGLISGVKEEISEKKKGDVSESVFLFSPQDGYISLFYFHKVEEGK